jgi:hypothetical protein
MHLETSDTDEAELRLPDASFGAAYIPNEKYERDSRRRNARRDANSANFTQYRFCQTATRANSAILGAPFGINLASSLF